MRILWHSNGPWACTGYGNQTRLFTKRIQALGHEVAISAFYGLEGGMLNWDGMPVYPKGNTPYGDDILAGHATHYKADIAITLIDAWVYNPQNWPPDMRWVPWFPIDMEPCPPPVTKAVAQAHKRIVYSKFAQQQLELTGLEAYYVPHGIDTKVFRPIDRGSALQRAGLPGDRFIVGIIGANKGNPPRKAWIEMFRAFANLRHRHEDALLYAHTNPGQSNGGVNMFEICDQFGLEIGRDVVFPNLYRNHIGGYEDDDMVALYNCMDVHLLASSGEGFGIPIVEAQSCGTPVIVGDWTSMGELCFSGWKIDRKDAFPFYTALAAYQFYPQVAAVTDALEQAYRMKGNDEYRRRARQGALKYDADRVTERYWKPTLAEIEAGL